MGVGSESNKKEMLVGEKGIFLLPQPLRPPENLQLMVK